MALEHTEITTKLGKLRGLIKKSISGQRYYSFQGIPYGKPPIGRLRFQAPIPFGGWEEIRDATKEGSDALQRSMGVKNGVAKRDLQGSEDCLFLNVYTPQLQGSHVKDFTGKPVMVWIHGGGFLFGTGSSEAYGPDLLLDKEIVLVTINYRCGALGFLSLQNHKVPGNAGLKDQCLALRWVKENIDTFGGDPSNVTIFGESAGGASAHFHILSPLSKGLFHKAILQSGSATCQWAFQNKPKEKAFHLAKELGCSSKDPDTVLEFLLNIPAKEIVELQNQEQLRSDRENVHKLGLQFLPCVEVAGTSSFLHDYPRRLMERGEFTKVPLMMGAVDKEGLCCLFGEFKGIYKVNDNLSLLVPLDLNILTGSEEGKILGKEILKFYTKRESLSLDVIHGYVDFLSDVNFCIGLEETRQSFLKHNSTPVFSYLFTFVSTQTFGSKMIAAANPGIAGEVVGSGASHGDEIMHLLNSKLSSSESPVPSTPDEEEIREKMLKAWTNFATFGDPNCKDIGAIWKPDNIIKPSYLELGKCWKSVDGVALSRRMEFWKAIYEKYSHLF